MYNSYFKVSEIDRAFYDRFLRGRLPDRVMDAHVHMNLPEHVAGVSAQTVKNTWALQYGMILPYDEAKAIMGEMFPGKRCGMIAFSWPLPEADIEANNEYLSKLAGDGCLKALMTVRPEWSAEYCERMLCAGNFSGFKPYPFMASMIEDDDVSIFDFMPKEQLRVLDKYKKTLLLHLPRHGRLPDDGNIREIREMRSEFPDITIVLAHFGKCFDASYFEEGIKKLGDDKNAFYYDTAGITDPFIYKIALKLVDVKKIIYGTDMPIFLWHGRMQWSEKGLGLLCREDFSWNAHTEGTEKEKHYTFFMYEQINNLLNALEQAGAAKKDSEDIFYNNAQKAYSIK
jgi:uncharacterized protein